MKNIKYLIALLSIAAFAAGCDKGQSTSEKIDNLKAETKEAAQDLKERDYTFAQKAEFTETMQTHLAEINKELDQLETQIEKSSAAAKAEAKPKLLALREKATQLGHQIDEAKSATESTWENVKTGSKKAYGELKVGFTQARQWLSEKIAP